jgi:hypothetical protein
VIYNKIHIFSAAVQIDRSPVRIVAGWSTLSTKDRG